MVRRGQVWLILIGVLIAVVGSLFLLWHGDPATGPDLSGLTERASEEPREVRADSAGVGPGGRSVAPVRAGPPAPRSGDSAAPRPRRDRPAETPPPAVSEAVAILVDSQGTALPGVEVSVQLSSPAEVLTDGHVRTDPTGRFSFRAPGRRAVLRVWCQGLRVSSRFAWSPDDALIEQRIPIAGRALIGRLVNAAGGAPAWPGVNLRAKLTGTKAGGRTALTVDRATGQFATLLSPADTGRDLVVMAEGRVGAVEVARVTGVEQRPIPLLVSVFDPRDRFGDVRLRVDGAAAGAIPRLAVIDGAGRRQQTPLARRDDGRLGAGPFALGTYQVRVVVGDCVSRWRQIEVRSGRLVALGAMQVRRSAVLRLQAADGVADPRSVRAFDESGGPVRFRYASGPETAGVAIVYPGRYRLELGVGGTRWVDLPPGAEQSYTIHAH